MEVKSKAQAMATALATIGKFVIRKKVRLHQGVGRSVEGCSCMFHGYLPQVLELMPCRVVCRGDCLCMCDSRDHYRKNSEQLDNWVCLGHRSVRRTRSSAA